ncbi:MAG: hypothetical protein FWF97_04570 [Alphaproteobacteria bacterium]|nr:hypothetical protein [Alphaproteobacteria bacterium]
MQYLDYFKLQSKNLLGGFDSDNPKYFPNARFWISKCLKDTDRFSLMKAQHVVANIAGFASWADLSKASDKELEVAKNIFDNRDNILARMDQIFGHKIPDYKIERLNGNCANGISTWKKDDYIVQATDSPKMMGVYQILTAQTLKEIYSLIGGSYTEYDPTSIWGIAQMTSRVIIERETSEGWGNYNGQGPLYNQMNIPYHSVIVGLWDNRKNFHDYLNQALDFFKKNQLVFKLDNIHWDSDGQICNSL